MVHAWGQGPLVLGLRMAEEEREGHRACLAAAWGHCGRLAHVPLVPAAGLLSAPRIQRGGTGEKAVL